MNLVKTTRGFEKISTGAITKDLEMLKHVPDW